MEHADDKDRPGGGEIRRKQEKKESVGGKVRENEEIQESNAPASRAGRPAVSPTPLSVCTKSIIKLHPLGLRARRRPHRLSRPSQRESDAKADGVVVPLGRRG